MNIDAKSSTKFYQTEFSNISKSSFTNPSKSSFTMIKLALFEGYKDSSIHTNQSV